MSKSQEPYRPTLRERAQWLALAQQAGFAPTAPVADLLARAAGHGLMVELVPAAPGRLPRRGLRVVAYLVDHDGTVSEGIEGVTAGIALCLLLGCLLATEPAGGAGRGHGREARMIADPQGHRAAPGIGSSLGTLVRTQRLALGFTQTALAARVRAQGDVTCSQSTIARLETGGTQAATLPRLRAFATALNLSLHDLLDVTPWRVPAPPSPPSPVSVAPMVPTPIREPGTTTGVAGGTNAPPLGVMVPTRQGWLCRAEAAIAHATALVSQNLLLVEQSEVLLVHSRCVLAQSQKLRERSEGALAQARVVFGAPAPAPLRTNPRTGLGAETAEATGGPPGGPSLEPGAGTCSRGGAARRA